MQEPSSNKIDTAIQLLRAGRLIAFPTETVYGLGANACNPKAVRRIFEVTRRPEDHPLILHLASVEKLDYWARDISEKAWLLAEHFWPGPLTLILKRRYAPIEVTGVQDTVGLRVPDHPMALAILKAFGGGVATTSANQFGQLGPTRARHVHKELVSKVDMILDGGRCRVGVESTILSLAEEQPRLLRPGSIPLSKLQKVLGSEINTQTSTGDASTQGIHRLHSAPLTRLEVWPIDLLKHRGEELAHSGIRTAMIFIGSVNCEITETSKLFPFFIPAEPEDYARKLYAVLRLLDGAGFGALLAEMPPDTEAWQAVNDRLQRACCNSYHVGKFRA